MEIIGMVMKSGDKVICIKRGKYRYRGHIIWTDDVLRYWCCPDPSDWDTWKWTLREIKEYIDRWEAAFEEGKVSGNIILASEATIEELADRISALRDPLNAIISLGELSRYIMEQVKKNKI